MGGTMGESKKLNNKLIDFIANLKMHGIMKDLNLNAKVIFVD